MAVRKTSLAQVGISHDGDIIFVHQCMSVVKDITYRAAEADSVKSEQLNANYPAGVDVSADPDFHGLDIEVEIDDSNVMIVALRAAAAAGALVGMRYYPSGCAAGAKKITGHGYVIAVPSIGGQGKGVVQTGTFRLVFEVPPVETLAVLAAGVEVLSPFDVYGLIALYEAFDADTVTAVGGGVTQVDNKASALEGALPAATQDTAAEQPEYDGSSEMTFDNTDDTLDVVMTAAVRGAAVWAFKQASYAAVLDIDAGTWNIGARLPGEEVMGIALYNREISSAEADQLIAYFEANGAGALAGLIDVALWHSHLGQVSFRSNNIVRFYSLPTLGASKYTETFRDNKLTTFPANVFDSLSDPSDNVFRRTFVGNALDQQGVENILVSIDNSGADAPETGINIEIGSDGQALTPAAQSAVTSLKAKGWVPVIDGVEV